MARYTPRQQRAQRLLQDFLRYKKIRLHLAQRRRARQTKQQINNFVTESTLSESSSESPTTTSTTDSTSQVSKSDESSSSYFSDTSECTTFSDHESTDSDADADSEFSEDSSVSSFDSDEETDGEPVTTHHQGQVAHHVRHTLQDIFARRYDAPRNVRLLHPPAQLPHVLSVTKIKYPDHFRQILRVTPYTFDRITAKICTDPVFINHSHCEQHPVNVQLAVTLYRFGHSGNAAGQSAVARWAGVGHGTVSLMTRRVMTAILRPDFMAEAVRFPTAEEKEAAKSWVEARSCKAWRGGWCLVDGTLIPLYDRPHWYGESYFDRKCNYSLNIQVRSSTIIVTLHFYCLPGCFPAKPSYRRLFLWTYWQYSRFICLGRDPAEKRP
jgi:hypothetical protein